MGGERFMQQAQLVEKNKRMKIIPGGNQMSLIRDTEEVTKFLEFVGRKAILNERQVNFRMTACQSLFSVLHEEEDNLDYILNNLDVLVNRFRNRNQNVLASTLKVYKSRAKSSIEDFQSWSADPFAWERAVTDKAKTIQKKVSKRQTQINTPPSAKREVRRKQTPTDSPVEAQLPTVDSKGVRRISFPIRPDFNLEISLPKEGITLAELNRLGLFLYPYCTDIDPNKAHWKIH